MGLDLNKARKELADKTLVEVHRETAWTWGSRAVVAFDAVPLTEDLKKRIKAWMLAQEYEHEALEHAALVDDGGLLVGEVIRAIKAYKERAERSVLP